MIIDFLSPPNIDRSSESQSGWLIEQDGSSPILYMRFDGGIIDWTTDSLKATRFSREEDALQASMCSTCFTCVSEHIWEDPF